MAHAALDAGVHCLRLNQGNNRKPEQIEVVAQECKGRGIPIRIGVNGGSLDPKLYEKHGGKVTPEAMVESAEMELAYFREVGFDDVKISVKASSVPRSEEHTSELPSLMRISYAVFCLKTKKINKIKQHYNALTKNTTTTTTHVI